MRSASRAESTEAASNEAALKVVLASTRALLWVRDATDARRVAAELVAGLGGELVPARSGDEASLAVDLSFGSGEPMLPAAPLGSVARLLLQRYVPGFVADAGRTLEFGGRTDRLVEDASIDVLTGLPNRRMVGRALGRLDDGDIVIMLDLDHFKLVNDEHGHAAGDEVLRVFGRVLRACTRGRDVVGRYGGEEFVVVLARPGTAEPFLQRLRIEWAAHRPRPVTFSAGVARSTGDTDDSLARADRALYFAKAAGRDRWVEDDGGLRDGTLTGRPPA
jgi:diguanylate cyclase (GGDEF)-like protein